jgi:hypothetical protein
MFWRLYVVCTRLVDAGSCSRLTPGRRATAGRTGRGVKPPPQFGQTLCKTFSTQLEQNVHS